MGGLPVKLTRGIKKVEVTYHQLFLQQIGDIQLCRNLLSPQQAVLLLIQQHNILQINAIERHKMHIAHLQRRPELLTQHIRNLSRQ